MLKTPIRRQSALAGNWLRFGTGRGVVVMPGGRQRRQRWVIVHLSLHRIGITKATLCWYLPLGFSFVMTAWGKRWSGRR